MRSSENGFTTHYNIGKWTDGDNPGAAAINNNWDIVDTSIYNATTIANQALTASLSSSVVAISPLEVDNTGSLKLRYDTGSFAIVSGTLMISGTFATTTGSYTGSYTGSFTGSFSGDIQGVSASFSYVSSSNFFGKNINISSASIGYLTASNMSVNNINTTSGSFTYISSSQMRTTSLTAYSASFNYMDISEVNLLGVSHAFTINNSAEDIDQMLTLNRTTGGQAIFTWNGSFVGLNKKFKPTDLIVSQISQTEPTGTLAGQIWLQVTP